MFTKHFSKFFEKWLPFRVTSCPGQKCTDSLTVTNRWIRVQFRVQFISRAHRAIAENRSPPSSAFGRLLDCYSILRFAFTRLKRIPEPIVIQTARSSAGPQPWCTATDAVTVEEITPPMLPNVFISAESEAE
jgi:hypothetical protein